jgi:hypothetical protein
VRRLRLAGFIVIVVPAVALPASAGRSVVQGSIVLKPGATVAQAVALPAGATGLREPVTVSGLLTQKHAQPYDKTLCWDVFYYNTCGGNWQGNGVVPSIWLVPPGWNGSISSVVLLSSLLEPSAYPSFSADHVYHLTMNLAGKDGWSLFAAATVRGGTLADWSGSFTVNFRGSVKPSQGAGVSSFAGEVTVVHADGSREQLGLGTLLRRGDQLQTGVDSHVVLTFPDGSTMNVSEMTELLVADLLAQGSRQNVTVSLKLGEVSAQVNPKKAYQTDFKLTTPSGTTSSRGTKFSVYYNPAARTTIVRTQMHVVAFQPNRPGAKTVLVPAGKEIQVNPSGISPLAPIGKAGARGGVDMQKAADLVLAVIDRAAARCNLAAPTGSASVQPAGTAAWNVTVSVPGKTASTSTWTVTNGKVGPLNPIAKRIASGCPGSSTPTWTGTWKRTAGVTGNLILQQTGKNVTGHYTWSTGGTIQGTTTGQTLTASFDETNYQGTLTLTLAGTHFTGTYTGTDKLNNGPISGTLNGTCTTGPCVQNPTS